jgi:uncharacterized membrane protein YphA (DoxX/SURF4 family)
MGRHWHLLFTIASLSLSLFLLVMIFTVFDFAKYLLSLIHHNSNMANALLFNQNINLCKKKLLF